MKDTIAILLVELLGIFVGIMTTVLCYLTMGEAGKIATIAVGVLVISLMVLVSPLSVRFYEPRNVLYSFILPYTFGIVFALIFIV